MNPKIIITGFDAGMLNDPTVQAANGFAWLSGMDIYDEPGFLKASNSLTAMTQAAATNNITDKPKWITRGLTSNTLFALGDTGRLYDYSRSSSGKWSLVTGFADPTGGIGQGIIGFNNNVYWVNNNYLCKYDGTTFTYDFKGLTSAAPSYGQMVIYGNKLYGVDGKYVFAMDSTETFVGDALDLPTGFVNTSIAVYQKLLFIGSTTLSGGSQLSCWNGIDDTFTEIWTSNELSIRAIFPWKNYLMIFCGSRGSIYAYNGAQILKVKEMPQMSDASPVSFPTAGGVGEQNGRLLFGFSNSNRESGIYMLEGNPTSPVLTLAYLPSTSGYIYSLYVDTSNNFYVGLNAGIDIMSTTTKITTTAYAESQIYDLTLGSDPVQVKGLEVIAKPLAASNSITVQYKKDNAASWTTAGTITSTNQSQSLWILKGMAKTIQIKLTYTCSGSTNTPRISAIKIY